MEAAKARIPLEWGLINGSALAGALRVDQGRIAHFESHARRLREGAKALGMPDPDLKELKAACLALIRANRLKHAGLRLRYFRDASFLVMATALPKPASKGGMNLAT